MNLVKIGIEIINLDNVTNITDVPASEHMDEHISIKMDAHISIKFVGGQNEDHGEVWLFGEDADAFRWLLQKTSAITDVNELYRKAQSVSPDSIAAVLNKIVRGMQE